MKRRWLCCSQLLPCVGAEEDEAGLALPSPSAPLALTPPIPSASLTRRQQRLLSLVRAGDAQALRRALTGGCCGAGSASIAEVNAGMGVWGFTLLHEAAYLGQLPTVQLLVHLGADVNAADKGGNTALLRAASWGCLDVVEWLVRECEVRQVEAADFATSPYESAAPYQVTAMEKVEVRRCIRRARRERLMRQLQPILVAGGHLPVRDLIAIIADYAAA